MAEKSNFKDVFLSHCVRTMGAEARKLYDYLQEQEIPTFLCGMLEVGDDFRKEINGNAANCKAMVVFLDEDWTKSGECDAEFKSAISLYNSKNSPKILPIVVGGFDWIKPEIHFDVLNITSRFQCLSLDTKDPQHDGKKVFAEIVRKCKELLSSNDAKKQSASSINEKTQSILSDFVTCQKCSGTFRDPRLMPCSHTFCKECLANWEKSQSGALTCPKCWVKCDIPVDKLPVDTRATQLIEGGFQAGSASSSQATATIETETVAVDQELAKWFEDNSIPTEAQKVLIGEAFDSLEVVLELTKDSLDKLTELKEGHRLKILKSIEKSKPNFDAISKSEEMKLVESIFDERILESGTHPKDASKFWAAFDEKQRDDVTSQFKKLGEKLINCDIDSHVRSLKADKLHKVAMVLCEAGKYEDAEKLALQSMETRENKEDQSYFRSNVLMLLAMLNRIRIGVMFIDKKDTSVTDLYKCHLEQCDSLLKRGDKVLSDQMKIKVTGMKMFSIRSVKARDPSFKYDVKTLLKVTTKLCKNVDDKGLYAEFLMNEALLDNMNEKPSIDNRIKKLIEARKVCNEDRDLGEFTTLMSRISYNLGGAFEEIYKDELSYECFRRSWLIDLQLNGTHHPETIKSGQVLLETEHLKKIGLEKKDNLPDDPRMNNDDLEFAKRLEPVYAYKK